MVFFLKELLFHDTHIRAFLAQSLLVEPKETTMFAGILPLKSFGQHVDVVAPCGAGKGKHQCHLQICTDFPKTSPTIDLWIIRIIMSKCNNRPIHIFSKCNLPALAEMMSARARREVMKTVLMLSETQLMFQLIWGWMARVASGQTSDGVDAVTGEAASYRPVEL